MIGRLVVDKGGSCLLCRILGFIDGVGHDEADVVNFMAK